ncbi:Delta-aminolevulinic acid dehydratase [Rickettsiales bacterium Ac37b]|nr:Delta-aminolevulinic acid dehydratase [Rickettsiales bacterium Ac37b]
MNDNYISIRPRRLRYNSAIRDLVRETILTVNDLVLPVFVIHGANIKNPIPSLPEHYQLSIDMLDTEIKEIISYGIKAVILFGIPEIKDSYGSHAYEEQGIIQQAIKKIKDIAPHLLVISDLCFCQYTDHGHCGIAVEHNHTLDMDNDATLNLLAKQAISHAKAGADVIAPSGMVDHMVYAIRKALDNSGFNKIPIMSYAVKYRSAMYGPFGAAAGGAAKIGDRSSYQMDLANSYEAIKEAELDIKEGADILIIKPAHTYLDIIYRIKELYPYIPIAAYHVSGEFAMLKAAIQNGWLEEKRTIFEVVTSIKRAGASIIITYFAKDLAKWLND